MALLTGLIELLLADPTDVRDVPAPLGRRPPGRVVVALVEAEVLRVLVRVWSLDNDRPDCGGEELGVMDVRALDLEPERPT